MDVTKHGYVMQVPHEIIEDGAFIRREIGIQMGTIKISDEEKAERARRVAERQARAAAFDAAVVAVMPAIDAITEPHWRLILDLHSRADMSTRFDTKPRWICEGCDAVDEMVVWPCRTVDLIAREAGIDMPDYNAMVNDPS